MNETLTRCFHCGLPVRDNRFQQEIGGKTHLFCCPGCQAAASTIHQCGLDDYYRYRNELNENPDQLSQQSHQRYVGYDNATTQDQFVDKSHDHHWRATLSLEGITCAACLWLIEHRLQQLSGVHQATLNLSNHLLTIEFDVEQTLLSEIFSSLHDLGYRAKPYQPSELQAQLDKTQKDFLVRLGIAGIGMMQVMMNAVAIYVGDIEDRYLHLIHWASLVLTTPVIGYAALPFFQAALRDLKSRHLGMDVPVSLALILAFIPSVWSTITGQGDTYFESVAMFTFFLLLGRFLEFRARRHLNQSATLDDLLPPVAHLVNHQEIQDVASQQLKPGDHIRILPGELIPTDAQILDGHSSIDESSITGEFDPVSKGRGDNLTAGTVNTDGTLTVQVTRAVQDSNVRTLFRLIERAAADKPAIANLADKGASWFVLLVLILALLTGLFWITIDTSRAFWVALSVLVVTCPCALSLATPVALATATTTLRKRGILPTRGHALAALAKADQLVFDKTGTLTRGEFSITGQVNQSSELTDQQVRTIAAALESHSEHPIARAFREDNRYLATKDVEIHASAGISGSVEGQHYRIGTASFACPSAQPPEQTGTWICLASKPYTKPLAWFQLADQPRPGTEKAIRQLKTLKLTPHLLTGDPSEAGGRLSHQLTIEHWQTGQSASDKVAYVKKLQQSGHSVIMAGDGINDAPVIAQADVSIAMASGTELTQQSADVLLLNNHPGRIADAVLLARKSQRIIRQNLVWALLYNLIALPLAMVGWVTPWMAAIGMSASSLLVVLNALRLHR